MDQATCHSMHPRPARAAQLPRLRTQDPVDLSLIGQRLDSGRYYLTLDMFVADVNRMCANARVYNSAETIYFKLANRVEAFLDEYLHANVVFDK